MENHPKRADARDTVRVYESQAAFFDATRPQVLFEKAWLDRFLALVPEGGQVLDIGCGTGRPIAAYLRDNGMRVTGIDAAAPMIDRARRHAPEGDWRVADMRDLELGQVFDGALSWDAFFHLTAAEQRSVIPRLARHLKPGAPLMLTVGPSAGEAFGHVGTDPVYHASLSPDEYAARLAEAGLSVVSFLAEDPDCDYHSVLLARRDQAP